MTGGHAFTWVDAFTEAPYGGNPCSVVFDADDIPVAARLAYTRETRLSECAFLVASDKADFGARYYLPTREILMAGHPTIATVAALIDAGAVDLSGGAARFTLEVGAGVLAIEATAREGRPPLIAMTQLRPEFGREYDPGEIAALYGLTAQDVVGTPRTVSTGSAFCITRLASHAALRRARLDADAFHAFVADKGVDFTEPYLCVTEGATPAGDTFARLLLPPPLPPEDPFTGSATGCMAAYLYAAGAVGARFIAEQGHWMDRPGAAEIEVLGPPGEISGVRVAGSGAIVMRGTLA